MTDKIIISGIILWLFLIVVYVVKFKKLPNTNNALLIALECQGIPVGFFVFLSSIIGWPQLDYEAYSWVIGIGGIGVFWIALDQLRKELSVPSKTQVTEEE